MGRDTTLITSFCAGALLLAASYLEAAEHGMDEEVLSQIPKKLQAIIDSGKSSGMVTLVARNGEIASIDAVGWRYMAKKEPLDTTDVFWAASITKPFVAYRAEKKIQWNTKEMRATNAPDAEQFIKRDYRKGWKLN